MFSGIIETLSSIDHVKADAGVLKISILRPTHFDDFSVGDSLAVNGVCLTVESFEGKYIDLSIASETLKVTRWSKEQLSSMKVNLERSLRHDDRIHGHLVTGHVDCTAKLLSVTNLGTNSREFRVAIDKAYQLFVWPKGSVAINGVSLTINNVGESYFEICLIPETLKKTNLQFLKSGERVNLEFDNMARGLVNYLDQNKKRSH